MNPELNALLSALEGLRDGVLRKLAGLSEQDARRSTVPSGTNLAGLVQHLTFVESRWFEEVVAGRKRTRGIRSMQVNPSISLRALRAEYKAACEESDAIVASIGDPEAPIMFNKKRLESVSASGTLADLRRVSHGSVTETPQIGRSPEVQVVGGHSRERVRTGR